MQALVEVFQNLKNISSKIEKGMKKSSVIHNQIESYLEISTKSEEKDLLEGELVLKINKTRDM
ncbi:hypothetical protein BpHYR1_044139 [Brachionus plicatilis]|uniref:Uncharacterized protein n=1 Tax=Brachionus plicatilis TaxID=10195 RepID=A0A3M7SKI8_BRAPC|nr:hypothetical protein BpHYR1_044139 [Brachionus plicatilis]